MAINGSPSWVRPALGEEVIRTTPGRCSPFRGDAPARSGAGRGSCLLAPEQPAERQRRLAGGDLQYPDLRAGQPGGRVLRNRCWSSVLRHHPVHRQAQNRTGPRRTGSRHEDASGRPAGWAQRQPGGDAAVPGDPPERMPGEHESRRQRDHRLARTADRAAGADHRSGLQPRAQTGSARSLRLHGRSRPGHPAAAAQRHLPRSRRRLRV